MTLTGVAQGNHPDWDLNPSVPHVVVVVVVVLSAELHQLLPTTISLI